MLAGLVLVTLVLLRLAGESGMDRYLLPVVPFVVVIAGAGWAWVAERIEALVHRRGSAALVAGGVALGQVALVAPHLPGALTFYNPLLGGGPAARQVLAIGQGEGLDRAAKWLNQQPGADSMVVASASSIAFAPYFKGRTIESTFVTNPDRVIGRGPGRDLRPSGPGAVGASDHDGVPRIAAAIARGHDSRRRLRVDLRGPGRVAGVVARAGPG